MISCCKINFEPLQFWNRPICFITKMMKRTRIGKPSDGSTSIIADQISLGVRT